LIADLHEIRVIKRLKIAGNRWKISFWLDESLNLLFALKKASLRAIGENQIVWLRCGTVSMSPVTQTPKTLKRF
jgi:hypothetical protein